MAVLFSPGAAAWSTPGTVQSACLAERSTPGQVGQAGPSTGHPMQGLSSADAVQAGTGKLLGPGCASLKLSAELPGEERTDGDGSRGKIQ